MKALRGGISRAFRDHRTPEARRYRGYCLDFIDRVGALPRSAWPSLKAAGVAVVELDRLTLDLDVARAGRRRRDQNRIRRQMVILRTQLVTLERRLEELAAARPAESFTEALRKAPKAI
jgi:hypothetical protein